MTKHVAVLLGGLSSEREVSLNTGAAVVSALCELGYQVTEIDANHNLAAALVETRPDVVFNALHGTYGEDGCVQGLLETMQIPYTHSGVLASAVGMDKQLAKTVFRQAGIPIAEGRVLNGSTIIEFGEDPLPRPFVIKPVADGSSVGVHIVLKDDKRNVQDLELEPERDYLIEAYIPGRELTVTVLDGKALGIIEIRPKDGFYNYRNKYTKGNTDYIIPAEIPKTLANQLMAWAEQAHHVLGCRGVTRSDFRYDEENEQCIILEINTHPGMTATSLVPKIAAHAGISFTDLINQLVTSATLDHAPR